MAAPRKTTAATAPADDTLKFSDTTEGTAALESINAAAGIVTEESPGGIGAVEYAEPEPLEVWREPLYPVNEAGVPESGHPFFPGDDVAFILEFLDHLAPEQFDRARQRFMQACNEERAAA